jgi:hypothetical protein
MFYALISLPDHSERPRSTGSDGPRLKADNLPDIEAPQAAGFRSAVDGEAVNVEKARQLGRA